MTDALSRVDPECLLGGMRSSLRPGVVEQILPLQKPVFRKVEVGDVSREISIVPAGVLS